mgnify:FL=1|jgi:hypothetical protein
MKYELEEPLNDGLLQYGTIVTKRDDKTKKKIGEDFQTTGSLYFSFMNINAKYDVYKVGSIQSVDIKVKCYYAPNLTRAHKILLRGQVYEVEQLDADRERKYLYLYLRKVGEWDGNHLIQATEHS